jgi:hypothetical protein
MDYSLLFAIENVAKKKVNNIQLQENSIFNINCLSESIE